ncbi:MAG: hypothetical protein U9Q06_02125 [Nanoarchaeota archaeon]|nr:hypothetical protein [Nanoarchaeota archaeon]
MCLKIYETGIKEVVVEIRNFRAVDSVSRDIEEYLSGWCRDWNFRKGKLAITRVKGNLTYLVDVLDEVPNP